MGSPIKKMLSYSLLLICLTTSSIAQLLSTLSNPTPTSSAAAQTHTISVGNGDHKLRPDVTQAEIGDIIEFQFFPPNHSVVRAEYMYPCIPYEMTGRGKVGFFSGFYPVDAILDDPPKWRVTINDTDPIFFYCSATGSCINYEMVGVINPNATVSLANQKTLAGNSSYMLQPGDSFPAEGTPSALALPSATPSSTSSSSSTTPSTAPTSSTSSSATLAPDSKHGLSTGAIVGIAIAGVAILALAAALFFFIGRSKTLKEERDRHNTHAPPQSPGDMFHSFPPPRSDVMSDASTRNSTAAVAYRGYGHGQDTAELKSPEYSYHGVGTEDAHLRSVTGSPGSDLGHGRNVSNPINGSAAPLRHPSVLLNPNAPRELYAPDGRHPGDGQY